jgi:hypothetical protein
MSLCPIASKRLFRALAFIIALHGAFAGALVPSAMALSPPGLKGVVTNKQARNTRPVLLRRLSPQSHDICEMPPCSRRDACLLS